MTVTYTVKLEELHNCRNVLVDISNRTNTILDLADSGDPDWTIWGLIGIPSCQLYWSVAHGVHDNLRKMRDALDDRVLALDCTAENYGSADDGAAGQFKTLQELVGPPQLSAAGPPGMSAAPEGGPSTVDVGGHEVVRFDPNADIPVYPSVVNLAKNWDLVLAPGREDWADLEGIGESVADIAGNALLFAFDPLNYLICAGLTFLIDVVQPLEDLLGLVTGNPERMDAEIEQWQQVAEQLEPIAEEILQAASEGLISWSGKAADAAKERLGEFAEGVASLADDVKKLIAVMRIAKVLMEAAQAFVIALMATLVEWLIFTWLAAMAAAVPTAGGSTAAAAAATELEAGVALSRGVQFVDKVAIILERLGTVVERIAPRLANPVMENAPRAALGKELLNVAKNPRTWVTPAGKALTGLGRLGEDNGGDRTGDLLDGSR